MAMGRRKKRGRTPELWVASHTLPKSHGHPFNQALNRELDAHGFDAFVEAQCAPFLRRDRRPPQPPARHLFPAAAHRLLRGAGFRARHRVARGRLACAPSVSRAGPRGGDAGSLDALADASLDRPGTHRSVFTWVLQVLATPNLVKGHTIGIDATTLEANAALRSIVRRDTGEAYHDFLTRLAQAFGIETPTRADLTKLDRHRPKKGRNDDWTHPHDPDARITKMKDGRTHLAHKAEHAVDMETGAVVGVTVQGADQGDTTTVEETLTEAAEELEAVAAVTGDHTAVIVEAVLDKGYHSNRTLLDLAALDIRAYIAEPRRGRRRWTRQPAARDVVYANRRRIRGARGRALQRQRAERLERPNAHLYETGGMRRTHLRAHTNILKRLLIHAGGFNLGLFMRHRTGVGTPRSLQGRARRLLALLITLGTWLATWEWTPHATAAHDTRTPPSIPLRPAWAVNSPLATGC